MLKNAKEGMKSAYASEEYALIQAINAYLEISKAYNLSFERLTEWYGIYFPELKMGNPRTLADLALVLNDPEKMNREEIVSVLKDEKRVDEVFSRAVSTMGRHMSDRERIAFLRFTRLSNELASTMDTLDAYIKKVSTEIMPNTTYLTDEKIAAELLSKAGSLERLAVLPASTIQLLGAEKSLFKHFKFGSKPPKYGLIFKMAEISGAAKDQRGKMARIYAAKISIALKSDYFTKNYIAEKLKEDLKKSMESMNMPSRARERRHGQGNQSLGGGQRQHSEERLEMGYGIPNHKRASQAHGASMWNGAGAETKRPGPGKSTMRQAKANTQGSKPWERKPRPWMRKPGQGAEARQAQGINELSLKSILTPI